MVEGYEIKVPITLKGGREGDRVGTQIGRQISDQIKNSMKSIGIGKAKAGGTGGEVGAMAGLSKGLGGVVAKLGAIGIAAAGILAVLKKSSPYLAGVLSLFGRAFMIFFRPFGDFLASILRPLGVMLMRLAVKWLKLTRSPTGEKVKDFVGGIVKDPLGSVTGLPGLGKLKNWFNTLKDLDLEKIKGYGKWLWEELKSVWNYVEDFGIWLWEKMKSIWNYVEDFGTWLWDKLKSVWSWSWDLGQWLWEKITNALSNIWDWLVWVGQWIWKKITEPLSNVWDWLSHFGSWLWNTLTNPLRNIGDWISGFGSWLWNRMTGAWNNMRGWFGGYSVGTPFVPETGLYQLHRGEQVITRNNTNKNSVVLRPTFQITGGVSQDIDMDSIVRRASRITEMELKKRGIL